MEQNTEIDLPALIKAEKKKAEEIIFKAVQDFESATKLSVTTIVVMHSAAWGANKSVLMLTKITAETID